jgi:hypothetical protein
MTERRGFWTPTYVLTGILPAIAILLLPGLFFGFQHRGPIVVPARIVATTIAVASAMVWNLAFAVRAFRRTDEYFQTGSKFAWYWGGSLGLAATAPVYAFIGLGGLHWLFPDSFHLGADLFRAFVIGYTLPVVGMATGSMIAYGVWRTARR